MYLNSINLLIDIFVFCASYNYLVTSGFCLFLHSIVVRQVQVFCRSYKGCCIEFYENSRSIDKQPSIFDLRNTKRNVINNLSLWVKVTCSLIVYANSNNQRSANVNVFNVYFTNKAPFTVASKWECMNQNLVILKSFVKCSYLCGQILFIFHINHLQKLHILSVCKE